MVSLIFLGQLVVCHHVQWKYSSKSTCIPSDNSKNNYKDFKVLIIQLTFLIQCISTFLPLTLFVHWSHKIWINFLWQFVHFYSSLSHNIFYKVCALITHNSKQCTLLHLLSFSLFHLIFLMLFEQIYMGAASF